MSYNSRTNFADPEGKLPLDEFIKLFTYACQNAIISKPKHQCQWHDDKYISDENNQCMLEATVQTAFINNKDELEPIILCDYHARKLNKLFRRK